MKRNLSNVFASIYSIIPKAPMRASIDVLPSKNQALCEYCTFVNKLFSLFPF